MGHISGLELTERCQGYILLSKVRLDSSYSEGLRKEEYISPNHPQIFIYLFIGHATEPVGSDFSSQGLNPAPTVRVTNNWTTREFPSEF